MEHLGDVVDRLGVDGGDHGRLVDVAHQRDLALDGQRHLAVGAQHDRVGLDADVAQGRDRVLGRLGLQLARGADVGQQRDVHDEHVVAADLVADLADGLQERQRLDVADRAADLGDDDVDVVGRHAADAVLDLVGDVRDDLDGVAEVLAAPLLGDDLRVDLAGGHVGGPVEVHVEEALVVADVQVGLGTVVGDEHLAVLERVHRARIDVQVRVELLHRDPQAPRLEERTQAGGSQTLAEGRGDTPGDEDVLGRRGCAVSQSRGLHGQEGAPVVAVWSACRSPCVDLVRNPYAFPGVPSLRFGAFFSTRPRATRVSATAGDRVRPRSVCGRSALSTSLTRSDQRRSRKAPADHWGASYPARTLACRATW